MLLLLMVTFLPESTGAHTKDWKASEAMNYTSSTVEAIALEEFFDVILLQQLENRHIPGAAVTVVKDGEILFTKGYGFANLEQEKRVVADETLFRTGSVAKLFTWTAVLQLVEQEKLDLHVDVNQYLSGFQIPATFPEPITLHHLMTHTAGFEDRSMRMMRAHPEDQEPLENFLAWRIPKRVYPPGYVTAYSNYGTALASHIVELVSGLSFEEYVENQILIPLGMNRTTFRQPVPADLADFLATGYTYSEGNFISQPFEVYVIGPAGGASATVSDIARFMIVHLQNGRYGDTRILDEQTVRLMHRQHFSNDPRLAGMAYGFYEMQVNGQRLLTHGGETSFFLGQLYLFPQENLGIYIVYNAPGGGLARQELLQGFFDRFYTAESVPIPQPAANAIERNSLFAGRYISTRNSQTTVEKLRMLILPAYQPITIRATEDGYLESDHPLVRSQKPGSYQPKRWIEVESSHYLHTTGNDEMIFHQNDGSTMMFLDSAAPRGYHKLTRYEELLFQPMFPLGLGLMLLGVLVFSLFDKQTIPIVRWLAFSAGGLVVVFAVGLAFFGLPGFTSYLYGKIIPIWWVLFSLPVILILLTVGLGVFTLIPWPGVGLLRHLPYALGVLAASGILWWCGYWNLLGWHF